MLPSAASVSCEKYFPACIQSRLSQALLRTGHGKAGAWKPCLLAPLPTLLLTYSSGGQILMALGHLKAQKGFFELPTAQILLVWTHLRVPFCVSGHLSAQEYLAMPSSPICQVLE